MSLPANKTKIVCTIGPASESPEIMEQMIRAGMNVTRLNFSNGNFSSHNKVIENLRAVARAAVAVVGIGNSYLCFLTRRGIIENGLIFTTRFPFS